MKILLIGPYAPHGQVGAIRIISLSRFLVGKGHFVTVLCLSENTLKQMDPAGLSASVPDGVRVVPYDITLNAGSLLKKNYQNEKECKESLRKLLKTESFDVALISGGPFYAFGASKVLRKHGIPYVVDYRDLHISSAIKRKKKGFLSQLKFNLTYPMRYYQEYSCVHKANAITVVSPEMKDNIADYFHYDPEHISVVYNGYDEDVLKDFTPMPLADEFTIGYFGKLMYYDKTKTQMLFSALDGINKSGKKVSLLHIGPEDAGIEAYLKEKGYLEDGWYTNVGQKKYAEGMHLLSSCNACLLEYIYPEGPGTKVFDYIYLNKPIIGVTAEGIPLENFLRKFPNAFVCHTEEEITSAILKLAGEGISTLTEGDAKEIIASYSRNRQNETVEELMTRIGKDKG